MSITQQNLNTMQWQWSENSDPIAWAESAGRLAELTAEHPEIVAATEAYREAQERVQRAVHTAIPVQ